MELLLGPLGLAVAILPAVAGLVPAARGWLARGVVAGPTAAWAFAIGALYVALGLHYARGLQAAGDEPHYLLMAQSLAGEGDLDLRDNFARGDFREYAPHLEAPHYGAPRADGRPFPAHSPGLPLLLAPVYAFGGRPACVVLMALLAAACVAQVPALALQLGVSRSAARFALLVAGGPPLAFYAFHVYTEVPCALALAVALRLLLGSDAAGSRSAGQSRSARAVSRAVGAALCASALPWLHVKMIPAALALGLVALARLRGRARLAFGLLAALAACAFVAYYVSIFGRATPLALYGGGLPRGFEPAPLRAALGLWLDRSFGLLPHAPVFLLALAALPLLARLWTGDAGREARAAALAHTLVALAVVGPPLLWRMWWGGMCPPARFLVPLVPTLAALVALRLGPRGAGQPDDDSGLATLRVPLLVAGLVLGAFMVARPAERLLLNRRDRPTRVWDALAIETSRGALSLGDVLPSLVLPAPEQRRRSAGALAAVLSLLAWDAWRRRSWHVQARPPESARALATGQE